MMGPAVGGFFGFVFLVVWLALLVYVLTLATRLVAAVEKIADRMGS